MNFKRIIASCGLAAVLITPTIATPAHAIDSVDWSTGSVVRARFWEHSGFKGAVFTVHGSRACTPQTSDRETVSSYLGSVGWNDVITSIKDYNRCDVKLFADLNYGGDSTGWVDYTEKGSYVGALWNDRASFFIIS
ncbi:peptidase inhibitor family I36 protein [Acidipropionibacterium timonense]|uniref:peptidase inhibitor family I36 protein n=1 Tax=Acidipropionibacterium timonense TaxID=2161818 RepID=UPI00102F9048|nr:peptidase inhibitor family I36 protein [Acidipropionibacterium timonense]